MNHSNYQTIIFDLDGTLIDSLTDIAVAANRALAAFDFPRHPEKAYRFFVGDGLAVLAKRIVPDNTAAAKAGKVAEKFKHFYEQNWDQSTRPYPGIMDMLKLLAVHPIHLTVLSNKPDEFTHIYVERFFPEIPFKIVFGNRPSIPKKPSPAAALEIARALKCEPAQCLFVGDTDVDIKTGKAAGMATMGVTWGFRGRAELEIGGADYIIETPHQLTDHVFISA